MFLPYNRYDTATIMTLRILSLYIVILFSQSSKAAEGDVRLAGSSLGYKGRVEVEYNGQWGTVCNRGWGINDAQVVCKQLGFQAVMSTYDVVSDADVQTTARRIWFENVACDGTETNLTECAKSIYDGNISPCTNYRDVAVTCQLPGYLGCFTNRPSTWHVYSSTIGTLTIEKCLTVCRSHYQIAALFGGTGCLCGIVGRNQGTAVESSMCNTPCAGNPSQRCGGTRQITSYYQISLGSPGFDTAMQRGIITSPNFPGFYTKGTTSMWKITFTEPSHVKVWFSLFDIHGNDYVSVSGEIGGDITVFLPGSMPEVWWSRETEYINIQFLTNYLQPEGRGFLLHFDSTLNPPPSVIATTSSTTSPTTTTMAATTTTATTTSAPSTMGPTTSQISTTTRLITTMEPRTQPTIMSTTMETLPPEPTFSGNEQCQETHGAAVIQRIDTDQPGSVLMINVGDPFRCNGFITKGSHWSKSEVPFNVSVWRRERDNEYYIVGRMNMPATPPRGISEVTLASKEEWIPFREGDYLGVSYFDISPLVYATGGTTNEASTWLRWPLDNVHKDDIDDMNMGESVSDTPWQQFQRAYSLQVTIRDKRRCDIPVVKHGNVMPADLDHVYEGDMLVVDCDPGYSPHFMVAKCLETGVFDFEILCDGDVTKRSPGLTFSQIIIMIVVVGVLGLFVLIVSCALVCGRSVSGFCNGSHRTAAVDYRPKKSLDQTDVFMNGSHEKKVNLIPIEDDAFSVAATDYGVDNPAMDGYKKPLYGDSGGIQYNAMPDDHYMGTGIYDQGNITTPPYVSNGTIPPKSIADIFSGPNSDYSSQDVGLYNIDGVSPPPPTFNPEAETDLRSPYNSSKHRPTSLNKGTVDQHHASMSTINNPVASTPSDTPANMYPIG